MQYGFESFVFLSFYMKNVKRLCLLSYDVCWFVMFSHKCKFINKHYYELIIKHVTHNMSRVLPLLIELLGTQQT